MLLYEHYGLVHQHALTIDASVNAWITHNGVKIGYLGIGKWLKG